jgi:tetratricopeptide (TPR) repeat protein
MMQGDYEASKAYARQGVDLADRASDLDAKYFALANLGYAEFLHGNLAEAQRIYEDLLSLSGVKEYSPTGRAYGLNNLGEVMMSLGEFERANRLFGEAYTIFKESNQRRGMAFTSNNLASVYVMQAKYTEAYEIYLQAHKINKEIGDRNGMGHSLSALGNAAFYQGNYAEAERYYHESLALRRAMGDKRGIADSLGDLADTALAKLDGSTAEKLYRESLDIRRQIGDVPGEIQVIVWLGMAQHMAGTATVDEIYQSYQQAYAVAEQQDVPFSRLSIQLGLGEAEIYRGNYTEAWQHFRSVLEYALEHRILTLTLVAMSGVAALLSKQGDQIMALEVAALVHDQPRTFMSFRTESSVKKLGEDICCIVSEEAANAAIERGKQRDVYQTVEELLQLEF